ncbi:MAG: T9SS type A sorting domain-containing protein [Gracilimonas sp.]|uniref:LamG-like jellyroll fold domain-containing protein n=1 Tax=Gracilimonas TaxID=649462 RepID=UPI001B19D7A4|nr:LamG-like jellyroll fold domain-containing protein [Gracilimonas sp.]MBO6587068.1 T9SS type A sorting domain-containing protein [Gracilimonas sp.]MBO6614444.1 T9SS type A sorting domain-containing protein [Gracilimonas sp.]
MFKRDFAYNFAETNNRIYKKLTASLLTFAFAMLLWVPVQAQLDYQWVWQSGSDEIEQFGVYGTKGVASVSNVPGAREYAISWVGPDGDLWLMGGEGADINGDNGHLNDLWRYDIPSDEWTWVSGADTVDQVGIYGTKGVASNSNVPGARKGAISWTGPNGNLWLMGGYGYDVNGDLGQLNDMWHYDLSSGQWIWVSGEKTRNQSGVYGIKGSASAATVPGSRNDAISWVGPDGDLWLMGGFGYDVNGNVGSLNDLWRYDLSSEQWTWESGTDDENQTGVYGTKGNAAVSNVPGGRTFAISWVGPDGDLWLMGGIGYDINGDEGYLNDLWRYDLSSEQWTWESGSNIEGQMGVYGVKGEASDSNLPRARIHSVSWVSPDGDLWLMGGIGVGGFLNDLWRYDLSSEQWTWERGEKFTYQNGVYGTKGIASATTEPGSRKGSITWVDPNGNFWLMGGYGRNSNFETDRLNDLWQLTSKPGALELDGSAMYGRVPDVNELDASNALTLETWVKFDDVDRSSPGQNYTTLVMKGDVSSTYSYGLLLNTGSTNKTLSFYHNGLTSNNTDYDWTGIQNDIWYHVAATYDGSNAKIYINGAEQAISDVSGSISNTSDSLFIGQNGGNTKWRLDGTISGVRVWDDARSQQEIQDNMNLSLSGAEPNLVGSWLPRTGSRHSASDQSGNGNNMYLFRGDYITDFPTTTGVVIGSEGWRFLAAPGDTSTYGELLSDVWTQGYTGSDGGIPPSSNVYYYDETTKSWEVPSNATNIVGSSSNTPDSAGNGALVFVYADDDNDGTDDPFPKTLQLDDFSKTRPVKLPLSYTDSGVPQNDGWHLVSNPYPVAINWYEIVQDEANTNTLDYTYIWDHSLNGGSGGYQVHYGIAKPPSLPGESTFDGRIPAFQSFWVKAEGADASLNLTADHHVVNTELYKNATDPSPYIKLSLEGQQFSDQVSVVFPESEDDARKDVPKLNSLSAQHAELFIDGEASSRWMAIHKTPEALEQNFSVPVDVDITVNGTYSLSWDQSEIPEEWTVKLEDTQTGERMDVSETESFEFTVNSESNAKLADSKQLILPKAPGSSVAKHNEEETPRFRLHFTNLVGTNIGNGSNLPASVELNQNYPNPFNPTTTIKYGLPEQASVQLEVYNMLGQRVAELVSKEQSAGNYEVNFDSGGYTSGVYIYQLTVGEKVITKKMTLIK